MPYASDDSSQHVLQVNNIWKYYGLRPVVEGVNFHISRGEVLGLLGPNGAGKTTVVGMCYGGVFPSRGEIRLGPYNIATHGKSARSLLGIVPQESLLDRDLSVLENLTYFGHHYGLSIRESTKIAEALLSDLDLSEYRNHSAEQLSGGMKRKLVLARALINEPEILFLDEPTVGLDPEARHEF